jgi:hypothetical protein
MREIPSTVTSKGRVTIPADSTVATLAGAAGSLEHPMDWETMRNVTGFGGVFLRPISR